MFNEIQENDIFTPSPDCRVKWVLGFHFKHVVSQRRWHIGKVITREVILQTTRTQNTPITQSLKLHNSEQETTSATKLGVGCFEFKHQKTDL